MIVPAWSVHQGDCLDYLRTLPSDSVHCCVTSPPYWGLRDYGVDGQIGLEASVQEHMNVLVEVFREVRRVLRPDGTCWLNYGDAYAGSATGMTRPPEPGFSSRKAGENGRSKTGEENQHRRPDNHGLKPKDLLMLPARLALALQADGWWLRSEIIWAKPNPMPESITDRPTSAHEKVFLLSKSQRYFYDADAVREDLSTSRHAPGNKRDNGRLTSSMGHVEEPDRIWGNPNGRNKRNVWTIPTEAFPEAHFATFPRRLVEPCVNAGTSEKGCCPECGAPWKREVERRGGLVAPTDRQIQASGGALAGGTKKSTLDGIPASRNTVGWRPTCSCPPADPKPCTVLDPFTGSGTTGVVALSLGRAFIGCELNPQYHLLACERVKAAALGMPLREMRGGQRSLFETMTEEEPA